jgi:hypothetical protein
MYLKYDNSVHQEIPEVVMNLFGISSKLIQEEIDNEIIKIIIENCHDKSKA